MFSLPDAWVWDFWLADTGEDYHLFFLRASRALLDPERRHWRASVGHAVSSDLTRWTQLPDAIVHSDGPAFDDKAIWTGSVVQAPDGTWRTFYTGLSHAEHGRVQRIGSATSADLLAWTRDPDMAPMGADPRWYEKLADNVSPEEHWRDPMVYQDADGTWHMLITARSNAGEPVERGVVGHATSTDLQHWTVHPPLSQAGSGFAQLEVVQSLVVDGQRLAIFSCLHPELSPTRRAQTRTGGVWLAPMVDATGVIDAKASYLLTDERLYVGRLVQDRSGQWVLLAFHNVGEDGHFIGSICDPLPVDWEHGPDGEKRLVLRDDSMRPPGLRDSVGFATTHLT